MLLTAITLSGSCHLIMFRSCSCSSALSKPDRHAHVCSTAWHFFLCVDLPGQLLTAKRLQMVDFDQAKTFLKDHRVKSVTWHFVLNNTTSTRPKALGGKVVQSLNDHKHFESHGAGFATPMTRCALRLPNSFAADDGKVLEVIGFGATRDEASEDACCGAMVKLLCAEPSNVVLRPAHWNIAISELLKRFLAITGQGQADTEHQPLAVPIRRAVPTDETLTADQKKQAVEEVIRRCLETHGGAFDPSRISSKRYGLQPHEQAPWFILDSLLGKGELRTFVTQHPAFTYHAHGPNGMVITWASRHAPDADQFL